MRSFSQKTKIAQSIAPASYTSTTNGTGVDLKGFDANVIEIATGALVGTIKAKVQESVDNSAWTDVDDAYLDGVTGNGSGFTLAGSTVQQLGYVGNKRYVRVILSAVGTSALAGATVIRQASKQVP